MKTPDFTQAFRAYEQTQALLVAYERTHDRSLLPKIRAAKDECHRAVDTWLDTVQMIEEGPMRAPMLFGLSMMYRMLGGAHMYLDEMDDAVSCYESAIEIGNTIGQVAEVVQSLNNLALIAQQRGRPAEAVPLLEKAIACLDHDTEKQFGGELRKNLRIMKAAARG